MHCQTICNSYSLNLYLGNRTEPPPPPTPTPPLPKKITKIKFKKTPNESNTRIPQIEYETISWLWDYFSLFQYKTEIITMESFIFADANVREWFCRLMLTLFQMNRHIRRKKNVINVKISKCIWEFSKECIHLISSLAYMYFTVDTETIENTL